MRMRPPEQGVFGFKKKLNPLQNFHHNPPRNECFFAKNFESNSFAQIAERSKEAEAFRCLGMDAKHRTGS